MLILSTGFVGLTSCILGHLIKKYKSVRTKYINTYLIILFLIVGLQHYQFFGTNESIISYTLFTSNTLFFFLGPILYFYIRLLLKQTSFNFKKDWVHFIPVVIYLICIFPWILENQADKTFFIKALLNNRLLLLSNPDDLLFVSPSILMIFISIHLLTYLIVCLYKIIHEDAVNPALVHTNATANTLIYLLLLFQCYLAIMYGLGTFSLFYHLNLSPTLVTNFPPDNFDIISYSLVSIIILVIITTLFVLITGSKLKHQNNISSNSALR